MSIPVIAHRGASAYALEHSFAAYDLALAMGADHLEVDVRAGADGELVVLHDATLLRTAGDPRALASLTAAELDAVPADVRPPTLDAVLRRYGRRTRYWIDMKDPRPGDARGVVEAIDRHGLRDRVGVQSFDRDVIDRVAALAPDLPLAQLYRLVVPEHEVLADLDRVARIGCAIGRHSSVIHQRLVGAAHARGLRVHPYTVNDVPEITRMLDLGVDGLITDRPDLCRAVVDGPVALAA